MQLIVDVTYWPNLCNNDMQHVAGFFCILKSPAHLTIHSISPPTDSYGQLLVTICHPAYN